MTRSTQIERGTLPPAHESIMPFLATKRVRKKVLHVEDLRKHLRQLPPPPSSPILTSPPAHGVPEQLPHALLVYDEANASVRANYVDFEQSCVNAVVGRMRFQNGALEALMALLEMARRLRGDAVQLKVSFKRGRWGPSTNGGIDNHDLLTSVPKVTLRTLPLDIDIFKDIDLSLKDIVHIERVRVERCSAIKIRFSRRGGLKVGTLTNDRIEGVEFDGEPEEYVPQCNRQQEAFEHREAITSTMTIRAPGPAPHPGLIIRDSVPSADMAPIQVAIFGLQQSPQQCLSFFSYCLKYCEKHDQKRRDESDNVGERGAVESSRAASDTTAVWT
ncbi:hypothetical protein BC826DRAFT_972463 [Russula brevipes]|nr:hypothetical protein BC826DRAFT_972463 [Russula brevipes]